MSLFSQAKPERVYSDLVVWVKEDGADGVDFSDYFLIIIYCLLPILLGLSYPEIRLNRNLTSLD